METLSFILIIIGIPLFTLIAWTGLNVQLYTLHSIEKLAIALSFKDPKADYDLADYDLDKFEGIGFWEFIMGTLHDLFNEDLKDILLALVGCLVLCIPYLNIVVLLIFSAVVYKASNDITNETIKEMFEDNQPEPIILTDSGRKQFSFFVMLREWILESI